MNLIFKVASLVILAGESCFLLQLNVLIFKYANVHILILKQLAQTKQKRMKDMKLCNNE